MVHRMGQTIGMNTNKAPRNGLTYTLNGQHVSLSTPRVTDKVRAVRTALDAGATDLVLYTNGRSYQP